jgi:ubiquitin-protein ligase E3 C
VPGGHNIPVTNENVVSYILRVADYRLNVQLRSASTAFRRGLLSMVEHEWVAMFNEEELQMLISGAGKGVNTADLRAHCQYAGGYHEDHPVIADFWEVQLMRPLEYH